MTEAQSVPPAAPRDVIVFVPGLRSGPDQTADVMAQRIARAINRAQKNAAPSFAVKPGTDEPMAGGQKARRATIVRTDQGAEQPIVDVYALDYISALTRGEEKQSTFRRAMSVAWVAIKNFPKVVKGLRAPSKTLRQKGQVLFASMLLLLLVVYFGMLVAALVNSVWDTTNAAQAITSASQRQDQPSQPPTKQKSVWGFLAQLGETVFLVVTVGGVMTVADLRSMLERGGRETRAAADYLDGVGSGSLRGRFDDLLDHVLTLAESEVPVNAIHVVSYSFGSIVALDSFFPRQGEPAPRMRKVDTLITIGCPFDFVRAYFPNYFQGRHAIPNVPPRWINIYDQNDILGSNFLDDANGQNSPRGMANDSARPTEQVPYEAEGSTRGGPLSGFRVHGSYFAREDLRAVDATEAMIKTLYGGTAMLG